MKTKTIRISFCFPAAIDEIWEKLQRFDTWQYIASPYAAFDPVNDAVAVWEAGKTLRFKLKIFGMISLGVHTINVLEFDKEKLCIYTQEHNRAVPVWNHRIIIEKLDDTTTRYTDEVEIGANWKTGIVCVWSKNFYRHRQKKWKNLLSSS